MGTARDLPIDTPTGTPAPPCPSPRASSRPARRAAPSFGNPRRLMSARSRGRRNRLGRGFASWASAVTVPSSRCPKPSAASARGRRPFLSNPPASPTGEGKLSPIACTAIRGSCGARRARVSARSGGRYSSGAMPAKASECAVSGGRRNSSGRSAHAYTAPC